VALIRDSQGRGPRFAARIPSTYCRKVNIVLM
jgi:hypothetical protein